MIFTLFSRIARNRIGGGGFRLRPPGTMAGIFLILRVFSGSGRGACRLEGKSHPEDLPTFHRHFHPNRPVPLQPKDEKPAGAGGNFRIQRGATEIDSVERYPGPRRLCPENKPGGCRRYHRPGQSRAPHERLCRGLGRPAREGRRKRRGGHGRRGLGGRQGRGDDGHATLTEFRGMGRQGKKTQKNANTRYRRCHLFHDTTLPRVLAISIPASNISLASLPEKPLFFLEAFLHLDVRDVATDVFAVTRAIFS